jgi:hypothetical protein
MPPLIGRIVDGLNLPHEWLLVWLRPVVWEHRWNCLLQLLTFPLLDLQLSKRGVQGYLPVAMLRNCTPFSSLSAVVVVVAAAPPAGFACGALGSVP